MELLHIDELVVAESFFLGSLGHKMWLLNMGLVVTWVWVHWETSRNCCPSFSFSQSLFTSSHGAYKIQCFHKCMRGSHLRGDIDVAGQEGGHKHLFIGSERECVCVKGPQVCVCVSVYFCLFVWVVPQKAQQRHRTVRWDPFILEAMVATWILKRFERSWQAGSEGEVFLSPQQTWAQSSLGRL